MLFSIAEVIWKTIINISLNTCIVLFSDLENKVNNLNSVVIFAV